MSNQCSKKIIGRGVHSVVYEIDINTCLKVTDNYIYDAFYDIANLTIENRKKYRIVPIHNIEINGDKVSYIMKRLMPLKINPHDKKALIEFSDYHTAFFHDKKLDEICQISLSLLGIMPGCELDLHYDNIMRDDNDVYYLVDPLTYID